MSRFPVQRIPHEIEYVKRVTRSARSADEIAIMQMFTQPLGNREWDGGEGTASLPPINRLILSSNRRNSSDPEPEVFPL